MLAYQRSQLAQLLRHAKATVPFYKTRLDPVFKKNGDIDWGRWHEIPIVTRADLRDRRDEMLATELPPGHGPTKTFNSSGSSGVPVSMEVTTLASAANRAATMRQFAYHENTNQVKPVPSWLTLTKKANFLRRSFIIGIYRKTEDGSLHEERAVAINRGLTDRRKLQVLKQLAVGYLSTNSNTAELLARANLKFGEGVRLDTIFCTGQQLTADQKDLFKESFGARGNITYSSKEGGAMGFECGGGPNFHVNSELVLLETVSPEGGACEIGQVGRVIITPFFSTALPLIRYDQGDTAAFLPPCNCGNNLPVLGSIYGRQDQLFKLPEGPRSITGVGANFMTANLNALAFQLAQTAPLEVEVRYVPIDSSLQAANEAIIAHLRKIIHPEMVVIFKPMAEIAVNSGGKLQRYVCEIA